MSPRCHRAAHLLKSAGEDFPSPHPASSGCQQSGILTHFCLHGRVACFCQHVSPFLRRLVMLDLEVRPSLSGDSCIYYYMKTKQWKCTGSTHIQLWDCVFPVGKNQSTCWVRLKVTKLAPLWLWAFYLSIQVCVWRTEPTRYTVLCSWANTTDQRQHFK